MPKKTLQIASVVAVLSMCAAGAAYAAVWLGDLSVTITADNTNDECRFTVTNDGDDGARDVIATMHVLSGQDINDFTSPDGWGCSKKNEGGVDTLYCDGQPTGANPDRFNMNPTDATTITVELETTTAQIDCSVNVFSRSPDSDTTDNYAIDSD